MFGIGPSWLWPGTPRSNAPRMAPLGKDTRALKWDAPQGVGGYARPPSRRTGSGQASRSASMVSEWSNDPTVRKPSAA
jgi:hypothetical protein